MRALLFTLFSVCFLWQCIPFEDDSQPPEGFVDGLRPVYVSQQDNSIRVLQAADIQQLGKIYYRDSVIFVNERFKGIHVIDNHNPSSPVFLKFIAVPGNVDLAVRADYLYVDHLQDLVTLDISDLENVQEVNRLSGFFQNTLAGDFPADYRGYFECVETERGQVVGWEEARIESPECWR